MNCKGVEGLASVLVEPAEKLQTLEPQGVHIAAKQVEHQVEHIADEGDNDKGHQAEHRPPGC